MTKTKMRLTVSEPLDPFAPYTSFTYPNADSIVFEMDGRVVNYTEGREPIVHGHLVRGEASRGEAGDILIVVPHNGGVMEFRRWAVELSVFEVRDAKTQPRTPTQAEFEDISLSLVGERYSPRVADHMISVFTDEAGGRIATVVSRDARKSWTLVPHPDRNYWVIKSIGEPTLA